MWTGDLKAWELRDLKSLLCTAYRLRIEIDLMDTDHNHLGSINNRLLDGAVDVDAAAEITRSLKLDLLDLNSSLHLDKGNPAEGSMFLNRMIRIRYCVGRPDNSKWYEIPIFTGPITKINRNGVVLSIECQGKESLADENAWFARSWKKGYLRSKLIKLIMIGAGETRFVFVNATSKTGDSTNLKRDNSPFKLAKKIASAMNCLLFYDGSGTLILRRKSRKSMWTFNGKFRTTVPQVSYDLGSFWNAVHVKGGTPKGRKKGKKENDDKNKKKKEKQKTARVVAPRAHPLSPFSLRRNGKPRYVWTEVEDDSLKTRKECVRFGKTILAQGLVQAVDVSFNSLPVPMMEENDPFTVVSDRYTGAALAKKFTITLTPGEMSVGYNRKVKPSRLSRKLLRK